MSKPRLEACAGCGRDVYTNVKPPKQAYCKQCTEHGWKGSHEDVDWDFDDEDDDDD